MMLGIRTSLALHLSSDLALVPNDDDYAKTMGLKFPPKGSKNTPLHSLSEFTFKDYAPKVFRAIRHNHDMSDADYLMTIAGNFSYYPFTSNSKSGCYFWLSADRRFIVKTVTHKEARLLFRMLPLLFEHQMMNPDSLINPIFGLHRLDLGRPRPSLYFIVIRSVFGALTPGMELALTFDLKGSKQGRAASAKDRKKAGCCYKDNDFREQKMKIRLRDQQSADTLRSQMTRDAQFLRSFGVMDYSVLLGVRYIHEGEEALLSPLRLHLSMATEMKTANMSPRSIAAAATHHETKTSSRPSVMPRLAGRWSNHHGGTLGAIPPSPSAVPPLPPSAPSSSQPVIGVIYYIGIIDMLTVYDAQKKMAFAAKSIRHKSTEISTINPDAYAERFSKFMTEFIVAGYTDISATTPTTAPASAATTATPITTAPSTPVAPSATSETTPTPTATATTSASVVVTLTTV